MAVAINTPTNSNRLLAALSPSDLARLRPHLKPVNLKLLQPLEVPNKRIENIYFMSAGIASVVAEHANGTRAEIGIVGREGMTGSAILLGNDRSPHSTYMQAAGSGERIAASDLRNQINGSETLRHLLLTYVQTFMVQTAHTAVANAHAKLPERLARWLLMAQDRIGGNTLVLTHEFLSLMLGVRRPGVTEAIQNLKKKNLIQSERGHITVLDRKGLERIAGDFYGIPEREYRRSIS